MKKLTQKPVSMFKKKQAKGEKKLPKKEIIKQLR